ncbi:unnamed protein product [Merluccius merluccius]
MNDGRQHREKHSSRSEPSVSVRQLQRRAACQHTAIRNHFVPDGIKRIRKRSFLEMSQRLTQPYVRTRRPTLAAVGLAEDTRRFGSAVSAPRPAGRVASLLARVDVTRKS